jgi:hypothetical protein
MPALSEIQDALNLRSRAVAAPAEAGTIALQNVANALVQVDDQGVTSEIGGGGGSAFAQGTDLTDANQTLQPGTEAVSEYTLAVALTANRTKTLGVTGAVLGDVVNINVPASMAFDLIINNGGTDLGTLVTAADSIAHAFQYAFFFNGVNWVLVGRAYLA